MQTQRKILGKYLEIFIKVIHAFQLIFIIGIFSISSTSTISSHYPTIRKTQYYAYIGNTSFTTSSTMLTY